MASARVDCGSGAVGVCVVLLGGGGVGGSGAGQLCGGERVSGRVGGAPAGVGFARGVAGVGDVGTALRDDRAPRPYRTRPDATGRPVTPRNRGRAAPAGHRCRRSRAGSAAGTHRHCGHPGAGENGRRRTPHTQKPRTGADPVDRAIRTRATEPAGRAAQAGPDRRCAGHRPRTGRRGARAQRRRRHPGRPGVPRHGVRLADLRGTAQPAEQRHRPVAAGDPALRLPDAAAAGRPHAVRADRRRSSRPHAGRGHGPQRRADRHRVDGLPLPGRRALTGGLLAPVASRPRRRVRSPRRPRLGPDARTA